MPCNCVSIQRVGTRAHKSRVERVDVIISVDRRNENSGKRSGGIVRREISGSGRVVSASFCCMSTTTLVVSVVRSLHASAALTHAHQARSGSYECSQQSTHRTALTVLRAPIAQRRHRLTSTPAIDFAVFPQFLHKLQ